MVKRVRVKGRGAEIFLGEGEPAQTSEPAKFPGITKATFYLSINLINDLEAAWLSLRSKYRNRKVTKSEIAQIALEEILKDWGEKQQDSTLVSRLPSK